MTHLFSKLIEAIESDSETIGLELEALVRTLGGKTTIGMQPHTAVLYLFALIQSNQTETDNVDL